MRHIELTGKYATGRHRYALVDDDLFELLNAYRWKAKPNGNGTHVYAVRNVKVDGKWVMLRMHRVVLGYEGGMDVDHINGNTMDNRRSNLRSVPRIINNRNTAFHRSIVGLYSPWSLSFKQKQEAPPESAVCVECDGAYVRLRPTTLYCGRVCRERHRERSRARVPEQRICRGCGACFMAARSNAKACSARCKNAANRRKSTTDEFTKVLPAPCNAGTKRPRDFGSAELLGMVNGAW